MTEGDKAICTEICREIITEVMTTVMSTHLASCPHGKAIFASKIFLIGIISGSGVAGSGITLALAKLITG